MFLPRLRRFRLTFSLKIYIIKAHARKCLSGLIRLSGRLSSNTVINYRVIFLLFFKGNFQATL